MKSKLSKHATATILLLFLTLCSLFLPVATSFAQPVSFGVATNFAVGTFVLRSVAVADFDGDGKLDLAIANTDLGPSNNVSVLLGDGSGSFGTPTSFPVGFSPESVAVGDFDRDGNLDLAVANGSSGNVSILLGTGTGSFAAATNFPSSSPTSVAVGDFNRDGTLDLAVANGSSGNVSILLGTGTGTDSFGAATNFAAGDGPESVAIGDFNRDGIQDLAVINVYSNNVSILLGTGTGSFGVAMNFAVGFSPMSVAVGDFNRDGKLDLAVANFFSNNVSILLGTGTGSFGAATNFAVGSSPFSVAVGDFNRDGKLDLAVANDGSNNVSILLGTGTGSFGVAVNFDVGILPLSVAVGDFNRDGKLDLAVANPDSNNVSILLGDGTGNFGAATNFAAGGGPLSVAVGDFNRDGKLDLAVANLFSDNISILLNVGTFILTVEKSGSGSGTVTSDPLGIDCRTDCTEAYASGTPVTLTGTAAPGFLFAGWSGDPDCLDGIVTMDADKTCTATFNLLTPLVIGSMIPPEGEMGVAYNFDLLISGGAPPYDVTIIRGSLPSGLGLGSPRIVGTPTVATEKTFTVRVTDQLGSSVTGRFKMKILGALSITTTALKAGRSGKAYKGVLEAKGGKKPYDWSLMSGSLPAGLTLNSATGAIAGIPTQTGTFNLTFQVSDPLGGIAQKALALTIN